MTAPIAVFQRNYRAGIHKFYTIGDGSSNTPLTEFVNGIPVNETLTLLGGNVGIGSTQPTELLDIKGTIRVDGNVNATNITLSGGTISGGSFSGTATQVESDLIRGTYLIGDNYNGSVATTWAVDADTAATASKIVARDASGNIYVANVGIGTTVVRTNLDVIGNTLISGNIGIGTSDISLGKLVIAGNIVPSACNVYDLGGLNLRWRDLYLSGNTIDLDGALISRNQEDGGLRVHTRDGVTNLVNITLNNIISSNVLVSGNIGIGTTSPLYALDTNGDINFTGTLYQNGVAFSGGGGGGSQWTTSGSDIYYTSGNVGIGTTSPLQSLHVQSKNMFVGQNTSNQVYRFTNSIPSPPSVDGFINGVSITALNKRTRTSYAAAKDCVSTWTSRTSAANNVWQSVCWAPELFLFCAVAFTGTGNRVMTSPDGITWTTRTSASDNNWTSVCWAAELSLFCAVASGNGTGDRVMTSPDGITWTTRASAADNLWRSVCWAPELSLFCAVSYDGTGDRVMTSPDGITWTTQISAADNNWTSICWSPELSLFCAVAESGTGDRVMTSPDGITWTTQASAANNTWLSVCWAAELSLFCAVAYSGTERVMTSPDGIVWTARTVSDYEWTSVCWAPELSLFCAVSQSYITGNRVMTSPDGITWTTQTAPTNGWQSVCWAAELSLFCSVCWGPNSGNRVMTSAIGMPNAKSVVKALPSQMMVDAKGNVGIGTTNPLNSLHVQNQSYFVGNVGIGTMNPLNSLHVQNQSYFVGNVGIGTTNPLVSLHVIGNATITSATDTILTVQTTNDANKAEVAILGNNQGTGRVYVGQSASYGGGIEYNGDNSPATTGAGADCITLYRRDNGTDNWTARNPYNTNDWEFRGALTAGGNLTVNESYTNNWFRVNGGGGLYFQTYGRGIYSVDSQGSDYGNVCTYGEGKNGWEGYSIAGRYVFMSADNDSWGIYNDLNNWWLIYGDRNYAGLRYQSAEKLYTRSDGVTINQRLVITGQAHLLSMEDVNLYRYDISGIRVSINGNWAPWINNNNTTGTSDRAWARIWRYAESAPSDRRIKTEIRDSQLGLNFINLLRPVSYKFKAGSRTELPADYELQEGETIEEITENDGHKHKILVKPGVRTHYGLIAQEVKQAIDKVNVGDNSCWQLADKNDPESQQSVSYECFISPLIKAVQELSAENEALRARAEASEARLAAIEEKLALLIAG